MWVCLICISCFFCFKQKTAYDMRISGWSSDVCSSDLARIDEADEFGRFLVEQGIAAFGVRRAVVPRAGQGRLRVRDLHRRDIIRIFVAELGLAESGGRSRIAAVAVGAAEPDRGRRVHRRLVGARVAAVRSEEHTAELQSLM